MVETKKVIIIGAGLTGLSAGTALQKRGINTVIYEMAPWAGGVCTAWTRKNFVFDGCIHWMVGTRENEPLRKLYESVGALNKDTIIYNPDNLFLEIDGAILEVPMDIVKFEAFLRSISKEDDRWITRFCNELKRASNSIMLAGSPTSLKEIWSVLFRGMGFLRAILKFLPVRVETYTKSIKNNTLQTIIHHLMPPSMSLFALIMMLSTRMSNNGGYPMGGAKDMISRMTSMYLSLGGELHLNSKIEEIVVDKGVASGVVVKGTFVKGDYIIAACDVYSVLNEMLKGSYPHKELDYLLKNAPLFKPIMLISYGLTKKLEIPFSVTKKFKTPFKTSDTMEVTSYHLRSFDFEESFAPKGKSSVMVTLGAPFVYWHDLYHHNKQDYIKMKQEIANQLAQRLELDYPGFSTSIEVIDVATPASYHRINNLYQGSYEGFMPNPETLKVNIKPVIPGINSLILAGQWTTPGGGIPPAIMSGIKTAKKVAKRL